MKKGFLLFSVLLGLIPFTPAAHATVLTFDYNIEFSGGITA